MGFYLHAFKLTLYFLYHFDDIEKNRPDKKFREIMIMICNLGGDTDTNCCIVGAVIGPLIGMKNFGFEFKQISTSCKSFDLTGSMAYSKDKTSIYISNINYCGKENSEVYDTITCKLYETSDNVSNLITTCKENNEVTIKDYLKNVSIGVDNYTPICSKYDDTSLYLEVEAHKDDEITTYKIPISLEENCKKE